MNVIAFRSRSTGPTPPTTPSSLHLTPMVDLFLERLRVRGAARNTLLAYGSDLRHFVVFALRMGVALAGQVDERLVNRWIDAGMQERGWSRRTAHRKQMTLHSLFRWAIGEGYALRDPTTDVRITFRPRAVVAPELEPLKRVVAAIGTQAPLDLRDRAMCLLMLDAALRASEVACIDVEDDTHPRLHWVDLMARRVHVRPKGGADTDADVVGLEPQTVEAIRAWLRVRARLAKPGERAMFVNQNGVRIARQSVYTMVRARGAAAGLPRLHPHLFRHRRIGDIVEKLGLDVGSAQARHRHKSTTVNVYGTHAAEVQRNAVRELAPLGDIACNG